MRKKQSICMKKKMLKFEVFLDVEDERWKKAIDHLEELVEQVKKSVIDVVYDDVDFLKKDKNFSINLALSNDVEVHRLNKEFRGVDKPTNVLSFANVDDAFFEQMLNQETDIELGDVIVAFETMKQQAQEIDVSFQDHFCHLWVHGMLHVLGYDHIKENERAEMEAKETEILAKLNIENPYQE